MYPITLDFDRTPPTAPQNVSVSYENERVRVSWIPVSDTNFAYYDIIKTHYDLEKTRIQEEFKVYQKTPGTFLDTTQYISLPDSVEYQVGTSNNITTAYAPALVTTLGTSLGLGSASVLAQDVDGQVIFDVDNFYLKSASTITGTISPASGQLVPPADSGNAVLNPDRSELYIKDRFDYGIAVVDTKTLQEVSYIQSYSPYNVFAVGENNLIYFAYGSALTVFNSATDTQLKTYTPFDYQAVSLKMSPAGDALIAVDFGGVKRFAVAGDSAKLTAAYDFGAQFFSAPSLISVDWNSSRIYVGSIDGGTNVIVLDAKTLTYISTLSPPNPPTHYNTNPPPRYDGTAGLAVNANNLYVAYLVENPGRYYGTLLVEYSQASMQQRRTWLFTGPYKGMPTLGLSTNGNYLFLCDGSSQWIVNIGDGS